MQSSQFQALINKLKLVKIKEFIALIDKITENSPSVLLNSNNYDKYRSNLERYFYHSLSTCLVSRRFDEFSQLFNYSDRLGIFIDVTNIDVYGIISRLHINGLNVRDTGRIVELVRFFNKYNLFERKLSPEELKIVQEIKENDKLLVINLKDLFGTASDSLIFYVCKILPRDYMVWLSHPEREFGMNPNFLRNWTDSFSIYGLSVRNLGTVEDFIREVETKQKSNTKKKEIFILEFNPRYLYSIRQNRVLRIYREKHLVYPENVLKNKEKILNKDNYNFYSLSMIIYGGLGPEGFGFTYSTPKGEVIEICSDQSETEAIIIKFKQYLKRRFLDKLEKEMERFNIDIDIKRKIIEYLSDVINPKTLISYYDRNSILKKIETLLFQYDEIQENYESEIKQILQKISSAISMIFKEIKLEDQFRTRMDLVAKGKLKSEDIAKLTSLRGKSHYDVLRERMFLQNKPKWFFKDYPKEIRELEKEYLRIVDNVWRR